MSKLEINANEVVSPDVGFMALVKRGANRIPFRVVKEDASDMIDLSAVTRAVFTKAAAVPTIVGVALAKGTADETISAALKEAGIDISGFMKAEVDGATTLTKADAKAGESEVLVLKFDDNTAIMVAGTAEFTKSMNTYDWESTSFNEVMKKGTFVPSMVMAQDMLQRTFFNIMEKADNPKDLTKMLKAATQEFEDYLVSLAKGLPEAVFKADVEYRKLSKAAAPVAADAAAAELAKASEQVSSAPVNGNDTKPGTLPTGEGNIDENPVVGNATPTNSTTKPKVSATPSSEAPDTTVIHKEETPDPVAAAMAAFSKQLGDVLGTVNKSIGELSATVKSDISTISKRIDTVAEQVKKTDAALSGTVLGDPRGDSTGMRKSEQTASEPPLLDTAFDAA